MSVTILLSGKLERAPEQRVSRNGAPFTMATLRVSTGNELQFWRLFVFGETAQAELARLGEGDALTAQGSPKFEVYSPEGGTARVSLSLTADHILALRQQPRERKKAAGERSGDDRAHNCRRAEKSRQRAPQPLRTPCRRRRRRVRRRNPVLRIRS